MTSDTARAQRNLKRWRENPSVFVKECFGVDPDPWQDEFLRAFPHQNRMALQACKGPGKTAALSWCAWNFLLTRPHPKVAATSITGDNLADGLWAEMANWQARNKQTTYPFLSTAFQWTKTRIFARESPETWFMSARSWSKSGDKSQQANTLAGLHADYLLFLIDESGGVPDAVAAAAEAGLATGKETKLLQAGNPTHLEGPLYRAATTERRLWYILEITADPDDPKRTSRVAIQWAREQIEKYGRDNPWVIVNVFGRFPPSSLNTLLGPDEIRDAMKRAVREDQYEFSQKRIGVDVARFGDDRTILFPRQGLIAFPYVEMRNARSNEIAARVALAKTRWGSEVELVDCTGGYGAGVVDSLIQAGHSPQEVNFSGKAIDARYLNKRAEMWFEMAEWVKRGGALPDTPDLVKELASPTYTFQNGKFRLEEKDQIKARLGFSPDVADALALTFALPEMPAGHSLLAKHQERKRTEFDYDPFSQSN